VTFSTIVDLICQRLGIESAESITRIGAGVNIHYKRVTSELGVSVGRPAIGVVAAMTTGVQEQEFTGVERIDRLVDDRSGSRVVVYPKTVREIREQTPAATDATPEFAVLRMGPDSVTVLLNTLPQTAYELKADGVETAETLSGSQVPQFSESYHDILIDSVIADERRDEEKIAAATVHEARAEKRLSKLRQFIATNAAQVRQGQVAGTSVGSGGTSSGSGISGGTSWTQSGLITFDRDPSAPFAVTANSAVVPNLDAAKVGGYAASQLAVLAEDETVAGTWGFTSDIVLGKASNANLIRTPYGDGSDVASIEVNGGGATGTTRGGRLLVYGNEAAFPGLAALQAGNVASSFVALSRADGGHSISIDGATGLITLGYGQVKFPGTQNPSTDVNVLDDYEEGSWTPVITGSGGSSGQTYSVQTGRFVKIGRHVTLWGRVTLSALGTITTSAQIAGFPYTAHNAANSGGSIGYFAAMTATFGSMSMLVQTATTKATLYGLKVPATGMTALVQGDLSATSDIIFTVTYEASQ